MKCQRFKPSGCIDIGTRKSDFVPNTQFLYYVLFMHKPPALHLTFTFSISGAKFPVGTDQGTFIAVLSKMIDRATHLENTLENSIKKNSKASELRWRDRVFAANSNFLTFISLQPECFFDISKFGFFDLAEILVQNINGLPHWFTKK